MNFKVSDTKYTKLLVNIQDYFNTSTDSIWDRRNKIKIVSYLEEQIAVKSFKVPHIFNKIAYTFFRPSKARRSYENSIRISEFVPKPIGYSEFKQWGLLEKSYFLSEKYAYDFTIREPLTEKYFSDKKNIYQQFALFTYGLHEMNVEHLDYSPGNILIKEISKEHYEFKVIDVNRMTFKKLSMQERLENFSKLWADEDDLILIIEAYAKINNFNKDEAIDIALSASQKHKDKINLKKKLKGKKVVN